MILMLEGKYTEDVLNDMNRLASLRPRRRVLPKLGRGE